MWQYIARRFVYMIITVWIISLVGAGMLFRAARHPVRTWSGQVLSGAMLAGWGCFNFVEGLIDHQLLGIHHVLPGHPQQLLWDMSFLASGVVFVIVGSLLVRSVQDQPTFTRAQPRHA